MIHSLVLAFLFGAIQNSTAPITTEVYFGDQGPYRFLVDTGSESSMIEPKLAAELKLRPEFRTEIVTLHGGHFVPGTRAGNLKLGRHSLPAVEILFQEMAEAQRLNPSIRGILGANALSCFDFLLSPHDGQMEIVPQRPAGEALPFDTVNGRMVVKARMGNETLALVLDSGASHIVLFRTPAAMAKTRPITTTVNTLEGARSTAPTTWTAELVFTDRLRVATLPAAIVERTGMATDGLLPASVFRKVFVDQARREVVLVR